MTANLEDLVAPGRPWAMTTVLLKRYPRVESCAGGLRDHHDGSMSTSPCSRPLGQQVAGPLAQMWADGEGPTDTKLSSAFRVAGLNPENIVGNKQQRVDEALGQVNDETARMFITELFDLLHMDGVFESDDPRTKRRSRKLQEILEHAGAIFSTSGSLVWGSSRSSAPLISPSSNIPLRKAASVPTTSAVQTPGRKVFVVHGRDHRARGELITLLKSFDLSIVEWSAASRATGLSAPTTAQVIDAGMREANAIVVLFTPDDLGQCKDEFLEISDGAHERSPVGQARLNVIFEAGMAWAL